MLNWQLLLVGMIVLAASAFLVRQSWRTWFGAKGSCGGGCSCAGKKSATNNGASGPGAPLISVDELTSRLRSRSCSRGLQSHAPLRPRD